MDGSKEPNNIGNVYEEFNAYARRQGIQEFRGREVTRNYAFEREDTPTTAEYLEVRYPAADPAVPADYSGPAIEAVFGTSVNALELFLVERNVKGPCWLDVKAPLPVDNAFGWSKVQVGVWRFYYFLKRLFYLRVAGPLDNRFTKYSG